MQFVSGGAFVWGSCDRIGGVDFSNRLAFSAERHSYRGFKNFEKIQNKLCPITRLVRRRLLKSLAIVRTIVQQK